MELGQQLRLKEAMVAIAVGGTVAATREPSLVPIEVGKVAPAADLPAQQASATSGRVGRRHVCAIMWVEQ